MVWSQRAPHPVVRGLASAACVRVSLHVSWVQQSFMCYRLRAYPETHLRVDAAFDLLDGRTS